MEYLIAFFIGVVIFRFLKNSIGSLASVPPEIDPNKTSDFIDSYTYLKFSFDKVSFIKSLKNF